MLLCLPLLRDYLILKTMDAVEEVKNRIPIEDVVAEYVELKRSGRNFKGLSPFTAEKTPSLMVSPEKQIWHDFSSGKGGNVFSFVMEMEGLDFKATLELLARKAGVDLDQYRDGRSAGLGKQKERLYQVLELATKFYQVQFSKSQVALEYVLKKRQYTKQTALDFQLGYAPNTGDALVNYLKKQGVSDKEIQQAGLSAQRYRGVGDMFRGRLMIPLCDPQGRVVGFTARLLVDDPNAPKYINTPQTILYDKSRHVFGMEKAKDQIRASGFSVLVEGNLDVIASHQAGVKNVVATAGTALTEMQLKVLHRFAGEVRLAFDQDRAGLQAAERAIPIAGKVGVTLGVVTVPSGKDPDELIKKDPKLWVDAIATPQPALDWLIGLYKQQLDVSTATGKKQFTDIVLAVVRQLPDKVEQDHYLDVIATDLGVGKDALQSKLATDLSSKRSLKQRNVSTVKIDEKSIIDLRKNQNQLLAIALMEPSFRKYLELVEESMLVDDDARQVFIFLRQHPDFKGEISELKELRKSIDYVKMLVLQYETLYQKLDKLELSYEAERLQVRLVEQYVKMQKTLLVSAMHSADELETNQLLEKAKKFDNLLKRAKEVPRGEEEDSR